MRRSMWPVALAALLLIDAVLIFWALRPAGSTTAQQPSTPAPTSQSPSTSASSAAPKADRVIVVAASATKAWRVLTGSQCAGSVSVQRTTDGGKTWTAGSAVPLKAVFSAVGNDSGHPVLSGLDAQCRPAMVELTDDGAQVTTAVAQWAIDPATPAKLLHNGQSTTAACESGPVRDLATDTGMRANVLCDGGVIRRTTDGGASWATIGTVKDAIGIATASAATNFRVYVATRQPCGMRVASAPDEIEGKAGGCLDGSAPATAGDITVWGKYVWAADMTKGWVTTTSTPGSAEGSQAPAPTTPADTTASSSTTSPAASAGVGSASAAPTSTAAPTFAPRTTASATSAASTQPSQLSTPGDPASSTTGPSGATGGAMDSSTSAAQP